MERLQNRLGAFAARNHRRPAPALIAAALLALLGVIFAGRLALNADLVELLPPAFQSVQDIKKLEERFGGIGWIVVVGEGAEPEVLRRFARDIAPKLEGLQGVRFVEYERPTRFFEDRALYFLETGDLQEVHRRLKAREKHARNERNPLYIQLEQEAPPSLDFDDLREKYAGQSSRRLAGNGESFYLDPAARRVVLLAKPEGNSADLGFAQRVVGEVEAMLATVDPRRYGPEFRIAVTGTYKKKLDQQAQLAHDIATSSALALVVLLAYLVFHFRSALAVLLGLLPVAVGLAWTYGGVGVVYGEVNLLTGFLGAILGGLGIEHGIHIMTRYFSVRSEGHTSEEATRESFTRTGGSALVSALVAALTFFSLAISDFRAFREFGVIAGVGMLVMVSAYVLVLPAALGVAARLGWNPPRRSNPTRAVSWMARMLPQLRWPLTIGMGVIVFALALNGRQVRFDYDFAALEDQRLPSFVLDKEVNKILGYSQTPVIVLTDAPEQERFVVEEITRRKANLGDRSTVDFVGALDDLVPPDQQAKRETLDRIGEVLAKVDAASLDEATREQFETLQRQVRARPFTRADLPVTVKRQFQGVSDDRSGFVVVFPGISLSDGARVRDLAREVRGISLPGGTELSAAGEPMVLADILQMVTEEGPPILIAALLAVFVAMWVTLGSVRVALLCLTPTLVSICALVGLMPLLGQSFNYLNILVLPVLIGTTVDAGVHLLGRLQDARGQFAAVYPEMARAISGGLLTSAVGFSALLLADHPGLNSIGRLANLGFATNLLVMLVGFPALLLVLSERRARREHASDPETARPLPDGSST
ncbi:MAG TPA: MMPL family transporter [Myxococcaceae bacterium]|nr:MMPL family transporter [Myxococcaceae bacterium]